MALPGKASGGGGGYLNGVAGVIVGYGFDLKVWREGEDNEYTTVSLRLDIKQDGADVSVKQFLKAGFLNDSETISEDGQQLISEESKPVIALDSEAYRLLSSLVEAGFPEAELVEANLNDLTSIVNARVTFKREVDVEGTKEFGKRTGKMKNGKEGSFNRDFLLVGEYHGQVEPVKAGKGRATPAAKAAVKAVTAKGGKANGAAKNAEADTLIEQAEGVLLSILADAGKAVDRTGLSAKIVRYSTENQLDEDGATHNALREQLRKLIGSEDFLSRQAGWKFDPKAKGQPVSL